MISSFPRTRILCIGLLITGILPLFAWQSQSEDLERLYRAPHGVHPLSGDEIMSLWDKVKANPQPYLAHLQADLNLEAFQTGDKQDRARAGFAASLLGELEHPQVGAILGRYYQQVTALTPVGDPAGEVSEPIRDLVRLRRTLLEIMGKREDGSLIKYCRNSLDREDTATRMVMRRYLRRVDPTWKPDKPQK